MLKEELDKELEEIQDLVKPLILWLHKRGVKVIQFRRLDI